MFSRVFAALVLSAFLTIGGLSDVAIAGPNPTMNPEFPGSPLGGHPSSGMSDEQRKDYFDTLTAKFLGAPDRKLQLKLLRQIDIDKDAAGSDGFVHLFFQRGTMTTNESDLKEKYSACELWVLPAKKDGSLYRDETLTSRIVIPVNGRVDIDFDRIETMSRISGNVVDYDAIVSSTVHLKCRSPWSTTDAILRDLNQALEGQIDVSVIESNERNARVDDDQDLRRGEDAYEILPTFVPLNAKAIPEKDSSRAR